MLFVTAVDVDVGRVIYLATGVKWKESSMAPLTEIMTDYVLVKEVD